MQHRRIDLDAFDARVALEQIERFEIDLEAAQRRQRRPARLLERKIVQRDAAGHGQRGRLPLLFAEDEFEVAVERGGRQLHRHLHGQIVEVLRQLQLVEIERELALARIGKRLAAPRQGQRCAVDGRREGRLDEGFDVVRQAGDERQGKHDVVDDVLLVEGAVVELEPAAADLNVVERKARRRVVRLRTRHEFVDQVGKIVAPVGQANDLQAWPGEADFTEHRPAAQQRRDLQVQIETVEAGDRFLRLPHALALVHGQPVDLDGQRVGIDVNALDRHLAMQDRAELVEQHGFDDRRQDEEAEDADERDGDQEAQPVAFGFRTTQAG